MFNKKIYFPCLKKQFFCFFLFLTIPLIAQKKVIGVLLDTAKNPISQVSIQLKDTNNKNTIAFA
jgi:hypothetical protein